MPWPMEIAADPGTAAVSDVPRPDVLGDRVEGAALDAVLEASAVVQRDDVVEDLFPGAADEGHVTGCALLVPVGVGLVDAGRRHEHGEQARVERNAAGEHREGLAAVARGGARLEQLVERLGVGLDADLFAAGAVVDQADRRERGGLTVDLAVDLVEVLRALGDDGRRGVVEGLEEVRLGERDDRDRLARARREDHHVGGISRLQLGGDLRVVGVGGVGDHLDLDAGLLGVRRRHLARSSRRRRSPGRP